MNIWQRLWQKRQAIEGTPEIKNDLNFVDVAAEHTMLTEKRASLEMQAKELKTTFVTLTRQAQDRQSRVTHKHNEIMRQCGVTNI